MRIIGVDLHTRQQTIAMWDTETRELIERTLTHDGDEVREFYSALPGQVLVGIEATGSMHWFLELLEKLRINQPGRTHALHERAYVRDQVRDQKITKERNAKRTPRTLRMGSDIFHPKIMEQIEQSYERLREVG